MDFLQKLGIEAADIQEILANDQKYGAAIGQLAKEYMTYAPKQFMVPYREGERAVSTLRRDAFLYEARQIAENAYMADLLFWLHCLPDVRQRYQEMGIPDKIFWETMSDIACKIQECRMRYGVCGVASNWYMLHFDWKIVAFGRLQYQIRDFIEESYVWGDYRLQKGDPVYAIHIPSSGKLLPELCMDSLQQAYEFLKGQLEGNILPVVCNSWLLYPPYVQNVFPEGSNMKAFAQMFDVIRQIPSEAFGDGWRIFGPAYQGKPEGLPENNSLRRNMVRYIKNGGGFGYGLGVLLYDGEQQKIINRI